MNIVILCARQTSERLPNKALVELYGIPVLRHIIERYQACARVDRVIVASPAGDADIERLCKTLDVPWYGGSTENVVKRMDEALKAYAPDAECVFRGLGDMPLFDKRLLDWRFDLLKRRGADVVWTGLQDEPLPVYGSRESPWSRRAWDRIAAESVGDELEHPGQWLYSKMREFRVIYTEGPLDEYYRPYRLELDTADDLRFFKRVFASLYMGRGTPITWNVLKLLEEHPEIAAINAEVETKTLTSIDWMRRGVAWKCLSCEAHPMYAGVILRGKLVTHCPRCGETRVFVPLPKFLARKRKHYFD